MEKRKIVLAGIVLSTVQVPAQQVQHFSLKNLPSKPVNELLTREAIHGESGTIGFFTYKKGAVVPTHQHPNEQYSIITQGAVSVLIDGKEIIVKAGEGIIIPPNIAHQFTALEDSTLDIDFFTPARIDWLTGADTYYTQKVTGTTATDWNGKVTQPELFAEVSEAVGNIAFTPQGDLVYSHHPFFGPEIRVMKYDAKT